MRSDISRRSLSPSGGAGQETAPPERRRKHLEHSRRHLDVARFHSNGNDGVSAAFEFICRVSTAPRCNCNPTRKPSIPSRRARCGARIRRGIRGLVEPSSKIAEASSTALIRPDIQRRQIVPSESTAAADGPDARTSSPRGLSPKHRTSDGRVKNLMDAGHPSTRSADCA